MNKKIVKNMLLNVKANQIVIFGLIKDHHTTMSKTNINYTNTPVNNSSYSTSFIKIPKNYSKIILRTNTNNTFGQSNSYFIFTNDFVSKGARISSAGINDKEIILNHSYKYIGVPMGNSDYAITNRFDSFNTSTFEFIK